jgi:putative tricarboxylic transport membrane protein
MKTMHNFKHAVGHQRHFLAGSIALAMAAFPLSAAAQDSESCNADGWPHDTIQLVSHASAGGGTDTTMRMWMDGAAEQIDEDITIVYKQGGGARAAHEYMETRGVDCHTIMALTQTHLYTIARGKSPIGIDDIRGLVRAMDDPSVIVVRADSPYQTYEELVAASQEQALTWGVAQVGGTEHIGIERWAEAAELDARVVPFGSGGDMVTALRSGAIDATVANISEALPLIQEGDLHGLALMSEERVGDLPDVPSVYEYDHDVHVSTTRGYYVHAETPDAIVELMESMILAGMATDRFQEYLINNGLDPEKNIAGADVWDEQMKAEYEASYAAMEKLGLLDE